MNAYLKDVAEKAKSLKGKIGISTTKGGQRITTNFEKWKLVTTHTARRSFATNEFMAGTPSLTIMAITGHKTEKSFLKYIKVTPKEHAQLLKATWEKRSELKPIKKGKTKTIKLTA
jgi:integrase